MIVVSDEIHCDLKEPGMGYMPFASVSEKCWENSIICIAPAKALEGSQYGKAGEGFLRMNLACQKSKLHDGLERLQKGVAGYEA